LIKKKRPKEIPNKLTGLIAIDALIRITLYTLKHILDTNKGKLENTVGFPLEDLVGFPVESGPMSRVALLLLSVLFLDLNRDLSYGLPITSWGIIRPLCE